MVLGIEVIELRLEEVLRLLCKKRGYDLLEFLDHGVNHGSHLLHSQLAQLFVGVLCHLRILQPVFEQPCERVDSRGTYEGGSGIWGLIHVELGGRTAAATTTTTSTSTNTNTSTSIITFTSTGLTRAATGLSKPGGWFGSGGGIGILLVELIAAFDDVIYEFDFELLGIITSRMQLFVDELGFLVAAGPHSHTTLEAATGHVVHLLVKGVCGSLPEVVHLLRWGFLVLELHGLLVHFAKGVVLAKFFLSHTQSTTVAGDVGTAATLKFGSIILSEGEALWLQVLQSSESLVFRVSASEALFRFGECCRKLHLRMILGLLNHPHSLS